MDVIWLIKADTSLNIEIERGFDMVEINRKDVEAVKLALKVALRKGISVNETIIGSIDFLCDCYQWSSDKRYLVSALTTLQAYLELGFRYDDYGMKFEWLMKELDTFKEIQFAGQHFPVTVIPLSKPRIKAVIGTWSTSKYHTMPIAGVLEDIIQKVENKEIGHYEYHSNLQEDSRKDRIFELLISEDASYLHDVQKDQYFLLLNEGGN